MNYQRKNVQSGADIGSPAPLPDELVGLSDETLADLSAHLAPEAVAQLGYQNAGFVPVAEPEPPVVRTCSVYEFMYERVTAAERLAIRGSADPHVIDFVEALRVIPRVELDGALTIAGLTYLESADLLAAGRGAAIRA